MALGRIENFEMIIDRLKRESILVRNTKITFIKIRKTSKN